MRFNEDIEGRQGLVSSTDCLTCPCCRNVPRDSGLGAQGYTGQCLLGKAEEPKMSIATIRSIPCMDRDLIDRRKAEAEEAREFLEGFSQ